MNFSLALISIEVLGMLFVLLLGLILKYRYSWLEFVAFAFFIGLGCISYLQFTLYLFNFKINIQTIGLIVLPALTVLLYLYFKFGNKIIRKASGVRKLELSEKLVILGLLIQTCWILFSALPMPVQSYDSVANFSLKAKILYFNGGIPEGFFNWSEAAVAHPDYPLLLPFYMTWVYHCIGFNDIMISKIMPVLYLAFLGLLYALLVKFLPRKYSLTAVFFLGTIPQMTRYATIMYADLALAAFITGAFIYLMLYFQDKQRAYLVNSAVLFGISVWVKNEAIIFLVVFFISLIVNLALSKDKGKLLRYMILACAVIFLVASPWLIFKFYYIGTANSDINLKVLTLSRFLQNLKDSPVLLLELQREVFNPKKWNLLWVIVITVLAWKRKQLWKGIPAYVAFFIFLSVFLYSCALIFTTSFDLSYHAEKEMSRFMLHFCGLFIFLISYLLNDEAKNL